MFYLKETPTKYAKKTIKKEVAAVIINNWQVVPSSNPSNRHDVDSTKASEFSLQIAHFNTCGMANHRISYVQREQ